MNDGPALHTQIAEQRRSRRTEPKHSIFHNRLPRSNRFKEILEGKHDDKSESAFYMKGDISEVK